MKNPKNKTVTESAPKPRLEQKKWAVVVTWQPLATKARFGFIQGFARDSEDVSELDHIGARLVLVGKGARVGQRILIGEGGRMKLPCIAYSGELEFASVRVLIVRDEEEGGPKVVVESKGTDRLGESRWVDATKIVADEALEAAVVALALTAERDNGGSGEVDT